MSGQTGLRKFSTTIFKDAGTGNTNQVVAANASCEIYRQGAKVAPSAPMVSHSAPTSVNVFSVGRMAVNDVVQQNADETKRFTCKEITSSTAVKLQANGLNDIQLANGDRLILINTPPSLYDNDKATGSPQANPILTDSRGYVEFYTPEPRFDMIVSATGLTTTVYEDGEGGFWTDTDYLNVLDFATVQLALDAIPKRYVEGIKRLYFPSSGGPYTPPSAAGWIIDKPMELFGDGDATGEDQGFRPYVDGGIGAPNSTKNSTIFTIQNNADTSQGPIGRVTFRDLAFSSSMVPTATDGTGDHVRIVQTNQTLGPPFDIYFDSCILFYPGRSAIRSIYTADDDNAGHYLVNCRIQKCLIYGTQGVGIQLGWVTGLTIDQVGVTIGSRSGIYLENCGQMFIKTEIGQCCQISTDTELEGYLVLKSCADSLITGGNYEGFAFWTYSPPVATTVQNGIVLWGSRGITITGNEFDNAAVALIAGSRGIYITDPGTGLIYRKSYGNFIGPNVMSYTDKAVEIKNSVYCYGNTIMPQAVQDGDANGSCKVVVPVATRSLWFPTGTTAGAPAHHTSHAVGITLPSVPGTGDVDTSVIQNGLILFDSTNSRYYFRIGGAWKYIDAADMH